MAGNVNANVNHGHSPYQSDVNGDGGLGGGGGGGNYYAAPSSNLGMGGMPMGYSNFQTAQAAPVHLG